MHSTRSLLVLLCAMSAACTHAPERTDVIGTYVFAIETDTLHLDSSGQYRRVFRQVGATANTVVDTGTWRMSNDGSRVALAALPKRWPAHGNYDSVTGAWHQPDTSRRGFVSLRIRSGWRGTLSLEAVPEIGWVYRRVE